MALPTSGALSLSDIQTEFGGSNPISLSEYYAGGSYVPSGTSGTNGAVPTSGQIEVSDFYGTQSAFVVTVTEGTLINGGLTRRGYRTGTHSADNYGGDFGSASPSTFNGVPITGLYVYRDSKSNNTIFYLMTDGSSHTIRTKTGVFSSIDVEGGGNLTAASSTFTPATILLFGNIWSWTISGSTSTAWPTWDGSGTRTVTINE